MAIFIGASIYSGKLELTLPPKGDYPDGYDPNNDPNAFIGFVKVKGLQAPKLGHPDQYEDIQMMYFKDYDIIGNVPVFKKLDIDSTKEYYFDLCHLRIPPEFEYFCIDANFKIYPVSKGRFYYGFTLLNAHLPVAGANLKRGSTLRAKTFVRPNTHYKIDEKAQESGGVRGCKSFVSFGMDKVPLFRWDKSDTFDYFMVAIGTEATIGYCKFLNETEMVKFLRDELPVEADIIDPSKRMGIMLKESEIYEVEDFKTRYGVHIVPLHKPEQEQDQEQEQGWFIGRYEDIEYR